MDGSSACKDPSDCIIRTWFTWTRWVYHDFCEDCFCCCKWATELCGLSSKPLKRMNTYVCDMRHLVWIASIRDSQLCFGNCIMIKLYIKYSHAREMSIAILFVCVCVCVYMWDNYRATLWCNPNFPSRFWKEEIVGGKRVYFKIHYMPRYSTAFTLPIITINTL